MKSGLDNSRKSARRILFLVTLLMANRSALTTKVFLRLFTEFLQQFFIDETTDRVQGEMVTKRKKEGCPILLIYKSIA